MDKNRSLIFTDDNLKRLKEAIVHRKDPNDWMKTFEAWEALLARLEAAEKSITMARAVILNRADEAMHEPLSKAYAEAMQEWRKAAGK